VPIYPRNQINAQLQDQVKGWEGMVLKNVPIVVK